jgi:hypothetical protein
VESEALGARMVKDPQRFSRDHQEDLNSAGTVSSAWKLLGNKGLCRAAGVPVARITAPGGVHGGSECFEQEHIQLGVNFLREHGLGSCTRSAALNEAPY